MARSSPAPGEPMPPAEAPRNRAAAILGVPSDSDADGVRAAFLQKLAAYDFTPPEEWNAAAVRLGADRLPSVIDCSAEYERADVAEFLASYWSLPPERRTARWNALDGRCRDGEVRAALSRV